MCGISGVISKEGVSVRSVEAMTEIIRHRGPDDVGYVMVDYDGLLFCMGGLDTPSSVWGSGLSYAPVLHIKEMRNQRCRISLGHRRLSILDLSPTGHQPLSYAEGRYWICFNGEIYNYRDIRSELQQLGYKFVSRTDTEVIAAAYAEWGARCLDKFTGMWAIAIYDRFSEKLFLARDRYGIKPLYYWFSRTGDLYFASEIKQFTVLDDWHAELNGQRAFDQLVYSFTDHTDETMFKGVYQLPSGTFYESSLKTIEQDNSGRLPSMKWYTSKHDPFNGTFDEAAVVFKELFVRSVEEHLSADVPVGTALSGGLDSSAIVCEVNRILRNDNKNQQQKTFSSCSTDKRFDERSWMDIIVAHTNVHAHYIYPELDEVFRLTSKIIWHQDEPYQSQSAFLAYNVFGLAKRNGVKVLLNGQGADEYLGGYGQFTAARYAGMIKRWRVAYLISDITNSRHIKPIPFTELIKGVAFVMLPQSLLRATSHYRSSPHHIKKIIDIDRLTNIDENPMDTIPVQYRTVPEISEHLTFYSTLPKYLRWEDRNSMAHSIEARVPFLDHRLVEFTYNLPDDFLEKDGINKRIMREALKGLLPERIKNRKDKMGFTTPEESWVKAENPNWFRRKISEAIETTHGIIKPEVVTYFESVLKEEVPFDYTYWRIIMFSEWIKVFGVKV